MDGWLYQVYFLVVFGLNLAANTEGSWTQDGSSACWCNSAESCTLRHKGCSENCVNNPWGVGCHADPSNLAEKKPSDQTGQYDGTGARDGDNRTCSSTGTYTQPWWWVDLQGLYVLHKVYIRNTENTDGCHYLQNFEIRIGNSSVVENNPLCITYTGPSLACQAWFDLDCDTPMLGRYVGVKLLAEEPRELSMCEVIVKGYEYPFNVAVYKHASQSDTWSHPENKDAKLANRSVDGNTGETYPSSLYPLQINEGYPPTCSHTLHGSDAVKSWWKVDLGQAYVVHSVRLVNRRGFQATKLRNFHISVGNDGSDPPSNPVCATQGYGQFSSKEFTCTSGPMIGRYVSVQLDYFETWSSYLMLCEVMVKGYKYTDCSDDKYGPDCLFSCSPSCTYKCDDITGACIARPFLNAAPTKASRTDTSVTIYWTHWTPGSGQGQGSVRSYTVQYRQSGQSSWNEITGIGSGTTFKELRGLQRDTSYQFRVLIVNGVDGQTGASSPIANIGTCGVPSSGPIFQEPFLQFLHSDKTAVTVSVAWQAVSESVHKCDYPVKYKLKYKSFGMSDYTEMENTLSQESSLGYLDPYTDYEVVVSVVNSARLQGPATTTTFRTIEGVPSQVVTLSVTGRSSHSLTITWQKPANPRGIIIKYTLKYWNNGPGAVQTKDANINNDQQTQTYNLESLKSETQYWVQVQAHTSAGAGPISRTISEMTVRNAPTKPRNVAVTTYSAFNMTLSWTIPDQTFGDVTKYELQYLSVGGSGTIDITQKENGVIVTNIMITGLKPGILYSVHIRAHNSEAAGDWSERLNVTTKDWYPEQPQSLLITDITAFNITLTWQPPVATNGDLVKYEVQYWLVGDKSSAQSIGVTKMNGGILGTMSVIEKLTPYTSYVFQVRAFTSKGHGNWSEVSKKQTSEWFPSRPESLQWKERTTSSIKFEWQPPTNRNGEILQYKIKCQQLTTIKDQNITTLTARISGLIPGTKYTCRVKAKTNVGYGEWSQPIHAYPDAGVMIKEVSPSDITSGVDTVVFKLPKYKDVTPQGLPRMEEKFKLIVVVKKMVRRRRRQTNSVTDDELASAGSYNASSLYVAALLTKDSLGGEFTLGDGKMYGGYKNKPLNQGNSHTVYFGVEARVNGAEYRSYSKLIDSQPLQAPLVREDNSSDSGMIAGIVTAFVVVIIIVAVAVVVILYRRRHQKYTESGGSVAFTSRKKQSAASNFNDIDGSSVGNTDSEPGVASEVVRYENLQSEAIYSNVSEGTKEMTVEDFLESMKTKTRTVQKAEYDKFPKDPTSKTEAGQKPENSTKNRYKNILPYDHTRVKLETIPGIPNSDYINADFVDAYNRPGAFIASQGPKDNTVSEFWRMLWEQNVPIIVMVTNVMEGGRNKCYRYWPTENNDALMYANGKIIVRLLDEETFADYVIRRMTMSQGSTSKTVTQFHFTSWPDHGAPKHATSLLGFRKKIKSYITEETWPVVVHCSAGVGRTGTYIALDYLLDKAKNEGKINVPSHIFHLRTQRTKMIQTVEQYYFLHDALLEAIQCGDTAIPSNEFTEAFDRLKRKSHRSNKSKLEEQFEVLQMVCPTLEKSACEQALTEENIGKNRVKNILPETISRPFLKTIPKGSTDYINAVYIDGFWQRDAYIITQMPLPHTMADFWCLVYDMNARTIVMMEEPDQNDETCAIYWPESLCQQYGPIEVKVTKEKTFRADQFTYRDITLTNTDESKNATFQVRQFQLHSWPSEAAVPRDKETILQLLEEVRKWQQQHENSRIVVQCINGAHHSGLYCAVSRVLEKMQVEQEIDVFQVVKAIRINRPQLVDTVDQYQFCYEIVQQYLDSMDIYSNFK